MILNSLIDQPLLLLAWALAVVFVLTIHEFSHALASTLLGDQTARLSGRLTLNPMSHVSLLGFVMLLIVGFGWGKPVPFNPYNMKNQRVGTAIVAFAGPLSNLIMATIFGVLLKVLIVYQLVPPENLLFQFINLLVVINVILAVFNLIPIPPLDGSKILFSIFADLKYAHIREFLEQRGPYLLLGLIILDNFFGLNILGRFFMVIINVVYSLIF